MHLAALPRGCETWNLTHDVTSTYKGKPTELDAVRYLNFPSLPLKASDRVMRVHRNTVTTGMTVITVVDSIQPRGG